MVDALNGGNQQGCATSQAQVPEEPLTQVDVLNRACQLERATSQTQLPEEPLLQVMKSKISTATR
ncbi:hypothetical protein DsansV1_C30g0215621 [Dioscorea sansibarensis]